MLKIWYEKKPFTFGAVFIFFFMTIPILDQLLIYPKMKPNCEQQGSIELCKKWIITHE